MQHVLRRTLLFVILLSLASVPTAEADKDERPASVKDLKSYKFVVESDDNEHTMRIKDKNFGLIGGGKSGFIKYRVASWQGKDIVQINMIEGVKETRGVGELLKKEVLRRYSGRPILSELVSVNRTKLLKVWAKGYPHSAGDKDGKMFRDVVPAMKFEGFDYTISPKVQRSGVGGRIEVKMEAARKGSKGSIRIDDPIGLDKILATTEPELIRAKDRPKTAKDLKEDDRANEGAAKKAGDILEKLADKVSSKERVKEKDLLKHLWDAMNDECGQGGRDGSGWAKKCLFTAKGRSYVVKSTKSRSSFYLDKKLAEEAEEFVDDNR